MKVDITFEVKSGKRSYRLYILADTNSDVPLTDVSVADNRFVTICCRDARINEETTHKDYERVFGVTFVDEHHVMVEFKRVPKSLRVYSQYNKYRGPNMIMHIESE